MSDLEQRVESLERQNRKLQFGLVAVVATLLAVPLVGAVMPQKARLDAIASRVANLETKVAALEQVIGVAEASSGGEQAAPSNSLAWHDPANWKRLRHGMSRSQVESILGGPTRTRLSSSDVFTLFWEGPVPGSGEVTGNVFFSNRRVLVIERPVFLDR